MSAAFGPYRMWPASLMGSHSKPNLRHRRRYAGSPLAASVAWSASFRTTAKKAGDAFVNPAGSNSVPSGVRTRNRSSPTGLGFAASTVTSRASSLSGWPLQLRRNDLYQPKGDAMTSYPASLRFAARFERIAREGPGAPSDELRCAYG